jgi:predicted DNA repair protein MutK
LHPHDAEAEAPQLGAAEDVVALEKEKIAGAVRTDFVLSAEIIAITLGAVAEAEFVTRVLVLVGTGILMTVGVYGVVAGIVKLDDIGLHLSRKPGAISRYVGALLVRAAPPLMKGLSIAGTVAVFLVGGGILAHGIAPVHHLAESAHAVPVVGWVLQLCVNAIFGLIVGALVLGAVQLASRLRKRA